MTDEPRPGPEYGENELARRVEEQVEVDPGELAHRIVEVASDKKAADIVLLRTSEVTTMADYFVIASGRSDRQVQALSQAIVDELREEGIKPLGIEGKGGARWVLIDYGSVIVHLFAPEEREYYGLERLWSKAAQVVRVV
ncbi:MAG TPA: ribosome silencing factor [Candidatus Limnocylindria bacterium]|jgi:ribosome-associated protein